MVLAMVLVMMIACVRACVIRESVLLYGLTQT